MALNRLSGRTYNDLSQYPVMPWVLSDFTSTTLDLRNPKHYRNLRYPMGAQTPDRRERAEVTYSQTLEMYNCREANADSTEVVGGPPYHCGSCYSNAGFVIWYLIRLEPFTSCHIVLQDGKFDRPDRQFCSVASTFHGCTTSTSDVKELTPEWYYLPDFLRNSNGYDFGEKQDSGTRVNDVELPPWACESPELFVRIHRAALESEIVSSQLHHWVDLVFGFKQRGPYLPHVSADNGQAAVDSYNVFHHLMYEGAVDLEALDPPLRRRVESTIENFGQIPMQLFTNPHPSRDAPSAVLSMQFPIISLNTYSCHHCCKVVGVDLALKPITNRPHKLLPWPLRTESTGVVSVPIHSASIVYVGHTRTLDRLVTIDTNQQVGIHSWSPDVMPVLNLDNRLGPASKALSELPELTVEGVLRAQYSSSMRYGTSVELSTPFAGQPPGNLHLQTSSDKPDSHPWWLTSRLFGLTSDGQCLISGGYWDCTFKVTSLATGTTVGSVAGHTDVVTCVAVASLSDWQRFESMRMAFVGDKPDVASRSASTPRGVGRDVVVTGSMDSTVRVWEVIDGVVCPEPKHVLHGHDAVVACVAVCPAYDVIASASFDGTVILRTMTKGGYLRTIVPCAFAHDIEVTPAGVSPAGSSLHPSGSTVTLGSLHNSGSGGSVDTKFPSGHVTWVGVSDAGVVAMYSQGDGTLRSFSVNGVPLGTSKPYVIRKPQFAWSEDGQCILAYGDSSFVFVWDAFTLAERTRFCVNGNAKDAVRVDWFWSCSEVMMGKFLPAGTLEPRGDHLCIFIPT